MDAVPDPLDFFTVFPFGEPVISRDKGPIARGLSLGLRSGLTDGEQSGLPQPVFGGPSPPPPEPDGAAIGSLDGLELLLFELDIDRTTLADSIGAYGDAEDPLLPVSEIARLLGLDIEVRPHDHTINGSIGESRRPLTVDFDKRIARIGGQTIALPRNSAAVSLTDIYLRASVLEQLLPLKIAVDTDDYRINLTATEKLPLQARAERLQRVFNLGTEPAQTDSVMSADSPYRWLGRPAFDFNADIGTDDARGGLTTRFEGRVAADLLKTDFTGFLSTDDRGRPASARVQLQRRDPAGDLLGPLHATYAAAGDVFTPSLAIGPRSFGGAGAVISTRRVDESNVFQRIDLRGELPVGYDVELYVNDVLFAGQSSPVAGRYEFLDVPLFRGLNIVRVVTYGPHGEREESSKVLNVGGGQLAAGRASLDIGLVRQDSPVIDFANGRVLESGAARGKLRFVGNVAYGLTPGLTVASGLGIFTDQAGKSHQTWTAGMRGSLFRTSVQADFAKDFAGGSAILFGAAGRVAGVSFLARHAEYRGGFVDETSAFFDVSRPMSRSSQLLVDFSLPFVAGQRLPVSGDFQRAEFADGGTTWSARARTTVFVADTLVALGTDYQKRENPGFSDQTLTGSIVLSRLVDYKWQLRASVD